MSKKLLTVGAIVLILLISFVALRLTAREDANEVNNSIVSKVDVEDSQSTINADDLLIKDSAVFYDDFTDQARIAMVIKNPNANIDALLTSFTVSFIDVSGNIIGSEDSNFRIIPAGETYYYADYFIWDDTNNLPVTVEFSIRETEWGEAKFKLIEATEVQYIDSPSELTKFSKVTGRIANNTSEDLDYYKINVLLFDDKGALIGSGFTSKESLSSGQTTTFSADVPAGLDVSQIKTSAEFSIYDIK